MSFNQSRPDKTDSQYRKSNRSASFNQQRSSSGRGAGGGHPAPIASNRGFNKANSNAHGGQSKVVNSSDSCNTSAQNHLQGASDVPVTSSAAKQTEAAPGQRSNRAVPKAPSSQPASMTTDTTAPTTSAKSSGDITKAFPPFQFGSISPNFMNGVQIPARTSSAPPNLDEQKHDQARHDTFRTAPPLPVPSIPKQQAPQKEAVAADQSNAGESQSLPNANKDIQVSTGPPSSQTQKPNVHSMTGIPMQMPFHQPQVQFGGPNPHIQSQGMAATSLQMQMAMPLPMGNGTQQQVFVPGLPSHQMRPQGIIHQGPGLGFAPQMAQQLSPQLGNMGMGMSPPYPQQQGGKFGGQRKTTVKITHPETHEELRLDKRTDTYADVGPSGSRSHPNVPQSQPIPSFATSHPINYYPSSYNGSLFFGLPSSHPPTSTQISPHSQPPRFSYPGNQGPHNVSFMNPPNVNPLTVNKTGPLVHGVPELPNLEHVRDVQVTITSTPVHVTVKQTAISINEKVVESLPSSSSISVEKSEFPMQLRPSGESSSILSQRDSEASPETSSQQPNSGGQSLASKVQPSNNEGRRREALSRSNSIKENQRKQGKKSNNQSPNQVGGQSTSTSSLDSQAIEHGLSSNSEVSESLEGTEEPGNVRSNKGLRGDAKSCEPESITAEPIRRAEQEVLFKAATFRNEVTTSGTAQRVVEDVRPHCDVGKTTHNLNSSALDTSDEKIDVLPTSSHVDKVASRSEPSSARGTVSDHESGPSPDSSEATLKTEDEDVDSSGEGVVSHPVSGSKDKSTVELHRTKSTTARGKKKRKEILQKADAAGTTSDLYMAYKGPEEKKETIVSSESTAGNNNSKQVAIDALQDDNISSEKGEKSKTELDDWEDAADISTPKLGTSETGGKVHGRLISHGNEGNTVKKYSRNFLLKFSEQCIELPDGFEITSDISDVLGSANVNISTPGRVVDRPSVGSRPDRRGGGIVDDDRWNKGSGRMDINYGGNVGFRPNQGGNYGVLRNPRGQAPVQYAGGILSGPMQSLGSHGGGMQRNNPDTDRWQRAANFQQKGLIPSPQTPLQMMHKAERKYEVGKITDEEQAKQRQLKGILNKLTPQNFEKLFEQVKAVNIDNAQTLTGVISQIFDKALMEPTFCEMYANFCFHLAGDLPDFSEDNEKITFKRLLLNKCQEEFERGEREQEEADKADEEGEAKLSEEAREEKRVKARRRMLGNIRLIGELYKKKMLTERIMHECIKKLLGQYHNPDEEDIEALCKLMSTIGEMIDHPKAKVHIDVYFDMMSKLSNNMKLSSRVRFMLKDAIDLRKNKWQQRRKVEGPKKIEEVHRDAAHERQAQSSRLARGPGMNPSGRRGAPMDFGPRGSNMLSSPSTQMGGFRGRPTQVRGFGCQDARMDDRQSYEARTLSVPLIHRPMGDDSITLGPQGGLARGMSIRGPPSLASGGPLSDSSPSPGDSRRMAPGLNGHSPAPERASSNSREDVIPRCVIDRFSGPSSHEQSGAQERNRNYGSRDIRVTDHNFDRSTSSQPTRPVQALAQNISSEKVWPDDRLRDMSMAAIKEFYSARDEKEVALCIKDLNSPSFHPEMISLWVTDSFERKDKERDLLGDLLVNLSKPGDSILAEAELVQGFESALTSLEDAVNDAPKAPEFLGRIFAKVVLENVVSLGKIGKLIHEGGEDPGSLVEVGLAADVLGSTLDAISSEKGASVLKELLCSTASNLRLETFQPPDHRRSSKLDKFMRG